MAFAIACSASLARIKPGERPGNSTIRSGGMAPRTATRVRTRALAAALSLAALAPAARAQTCTVALPDNVLTAAGLSTPFIVSGCDQADPAGGEATFAEAAIITPTRVFLFNPLLINAGQKFVPPTPLPALPPDATVALWFGTNAGAVRLTNKPAGGVCGDGFGQFAHCNGPQAFAAAWWVFPPALGRARDGLPCPTTRDFSIVDADPSDNVNTVYLLLPDGTIMSDTAANRAVHPDAVEVVNGSDERLLAVAVDGALGCTPFMAPDLGDGGAPKPALFLNELSAARWQRAPIALVPPLNPMAMTNGAPDTAKMNRYRAAVGQPANVSADSKAFCRHLKAATTRLQGQRALFIEAPSPDPAAAVNLYAFLAQRLAATWSILSCPVLSGEPFIVSVQVDATGAAVDATYPLAKPGAGSGASAAPAGAHWPVLALAVAGAAAVAMAAASQA